MGGWTRHGIWNSLEHGVTRGFDAAVSLMLIWLFSTEAFAHLAMAQAMSAPLLFFFISPGWALYRHYSQWKAQGTEVLADRLRALRVFGWLMGGVLVALAAVAAPFFPGPLSYADSFWALLWALLLHTGAYIAGADREQLRLDLRLRRLLGVTLYQKVTVLGGTIAVALYLPNRYDALTGVTCFSMFSSAWLARRSLGPELRHPSTLGSQPMARTWLEVGREFSIWNHLSGISLNWVLTLDLFFLGYFLFGAERARTLGLYAVGLKFANFTGTLPQAFNSIFQVWLGRRHAGDPDGIARERREVLRAGGILFLGSALQAGAFMALAPFAVRLFSRGRWDGADQALIVPWMRWIVAGSALYSGTLLLSSWIMMRGRQKDAFFRLYLPYLGAAAAIYGGAAFWGGPEGAARANIAVSAVFVAMAWRYASRSLVAPGQAAKR